MNCKYCGFSLEEAFPLCPACGQWVLELPIGLPAPSKKRSRLPYLLLAVMLLLGTLLYFTIPMDNPVSSGISEPGTDGSVLFQKDCFILKNGTLHFDESKFHGSPVLIVPAAIDGQPVLAIADGCFAGLKGVSTIILPSSVAQIGDSAFADCSDLRGLCLPNAAQSIGNAAFRGCKNLEAVYLPTGLSGVGRDAFEDCPELRFVFYNGLYEDWISTYPQIITPFTWVICWDGDYRHGAEKP